MRVVWLLCIRSPPCYIDGGSDACDNGRMTISLQQNLFENIPAPERMPRGKAATGKSGTFGDNMKLPIHRWFRYSAGFSSTWVKEVIADHNARTVLDPFAGSGTVCVASDELRVDSYGIEAHPFVYRLAKGKLSWATSITDFQQAIAEIEDRAASLRSKPPTKIPELLAKCYTGDTLADLFRIREAYSKVALALPEDLGSLVFLAINAILRPSSHVGTAQWQYVLPNKRKAKVSSPADALTVQALMMAEDMQYMQLVAKASRAEFLLCDARTLEGVPDGVIDLVVTSPPYANNYDYADATRLEMTFWGEVDSWGDLHETVRKFLIRSSSQHASKDRLDLDTLLAEPVTEPIRGELTAVCRKLAEVRGTKGGNKAYHTMIAAYFADMGQAFCALRRVTTRDCNVCLVIGDSAPYGVYAPVDKWLGELSLAAGFRCWSFEKIRDRNVKWKNRKHTVPLHEGRLWING